MAVKIGKTQLLCALLIAIVSTTCKAAWFDAAWRYRRPIQITWDDDHPSGEDLATAVFYTDGHALPSGEDIRVATEDGKPVASHVLMAGPGDRFRIVFSMVKNVRTYEIYFGNPTPKPAPEGMDDVHYKSGVLLETKVWTGGAITSFEQIEKSWDRSRPVLGKMMVDSVFLGYNPFGPQEQWISKFQGSLFAPMDGDYEFAVAADDKAALYIDGKPLVFAELGPGDTRYHAGIHLQRGRHDLLAYHVNIAGGAYVSVGWKRPDAQRYAVINRESFGICYSGLIGPMEEHDHSLVADFSATQVGECFVSGAYVFHYHLAFKSRLTAPLKPHWDFGDGQTSDLSEVDHVYLFDGVYPVKLTVTVDGNTDTQVCKLAVERNYAHLLDVREQTPDVFSQILQDYDLNTMPSASTSRALQVHLDADKPEAAVLIARKLAATKTHADPVAMLNALSLLQKKLIQTNQPDSMQSIWDLVPADSDLQPGAARHAAEMAIYWSGDFAKAAKLIKPYRDRADPQIQLVLGQALVLTGEAQSGSKILRGIKVNAPQNRKAALSGAAARSVDFFITNNDAESGEEAWENWQQRFPSDFLEGYSVLLRTGLMELRKRPDAAAKLAEAFALAVPGSPYAPQLLDKASRLLNVSDPVKSRTLRNLLQQKYPEDPLSQQK